MDPPNEVASERAEPAEAVVRCEPYEGASHNLPPDVASLRTELAGSQSINKRGEMHAQKRTS